MSEFKGTPGPWTARCFQVHAADFSDICHTGGTRYKHGVTPQPEEAQANAALIAAAPDLLEALRNLVRATEDNDNIGDYGVSRDADEMIVARAAIAKALGEAK